MKQHSVIPKSCPYCCKKQFRKKGYFYKKITKTYIPRYLCLECYKSFSTRTLSITFKQKRPDMNILIFQSLCSGVTLRQTARNLHSSYRTIYKKFLWISKLAQRFHENQRFLINELQFDEMESIEHTKLKPLTIALAVSNDYQIISSIVGKIPAKGRLANLSRNKYGYRENESHKCLEAILSEAKSLIASKDFKIKSDSKPTYKSVVDKYFPENHYEQVLSRGQIEKKREQKYLNTEKKIFDPLFALNQRCAKLRADIRRLTRRSWCTTKKPEHLQKHLMLYIAQNNNYKFL